MVKEKQQEKQKDKGRKKPRKADVLFQLFRGASGYQARRRNNVSCLLLHIHFFFFRVLHFVHTLFQYIFEEHFQKMTGGKSVFTGLKATTHFGRPQMNKIMTSVHKAHPQVNLRRLEATC